MIKREKLLTKAFLRGLISTTEYVTKMIELTKELKLYNLKCEDIDNIYNVTIYAKDIDQANELSKGYLKKLNAYPIAIWEV